MVRHYALALQENHGGYMLPQHLQGSADLLKLVNILNLTKKLYDRIRQWVEALYKTWNVVS